MKKTILLPVAALLCAALTFPAAAAAPFSDVPADAWYAQAAAYCRENGLMGGTGGGAFSPGQTMSRAMLVTALYRLSGSPEAGEQTFSDVAPDGWYAAAVGWAAENGVITGFGDGTFRPDAPVTREQLTAILWRLAGQPAVEQGEDFTDEAEIAAYATAAVDWARRQGIVGGRSGGRFAPAESATRAEMAAILARFAWSQGLGPTCAPAGILSTAGGALLVTDTNNKVIWRLRAGAGQRYAGGETSPDLYGAPVGGYNDSDLLKSQFKEPWAITPFLDGYAVSDAANDAVRLVRVSTVETVNGSTKESLKVNGLGVAFKHPTGLATDGDGSLYVSDTLNNAVRRITPEGEVTTVARNLEDPMGLCWKDGVLYIAETGANRIVKLENGAVSVLAGSGDAGLADGPAKRAAFNAPQCLTVDDDGTVYVSDTANGAVRRIRDGQVDTILSRDQSSQASFPVSPMGLAVSGGKLYVCDNFSRRVISLSLSEVG